jgi:hypothetical protein
MSKRVPSTLRSPIPLPLAFGCPMEGAQQFLTARLTMRGKAIDLFLRDRALTLGTRPPKIAATEVDING